MKESQVCAATFKALSAMNLNELLDWLHDKDPDFVLLEEEAAVILRKARRTLQMWRHEGVGPKFILLGSTAVGYRLGTLRAYIRGSEVSSTAEAALLRRQRMRA